MKEESDLKSHSDKKRGNRFFEAVPGKTKEIKIRWHDYEDGRSLEETIHIPIDQDPEVGATSFLMINIPGQYDFEGAKERWRIEIGPVFEGPGPGDGSDAAFAVETFDGSKDEADLRGMSLCSEWEQKNENWNSELGCFGVGASVTQIS